MQSSILQQLLLHFNPTSSNPDDKRYPRTKWFRLLRWIGIHWWQGLFIILSAFLSTYYLPIAFANFSNLFLQGGFPALLNIPNVMHALFPNQLFPLLGHYWNMRQQLVIMLIICALLLVLLGLWAYPDQKREGNVLALRDERDKQRQNEESLRKQLEDQNKELVTNVGKVFDERSEKTVERTVTAISKVINPSFSLPFDEVAARNKYLESMNKLYNSVQLPIGRSEDFSLLAVFQPLKLRRDPLAVEDLKREERRRLLGESIAQYGDQGRLLSGLGKQHSVGLQQQAQPIVLADNGNDALAKSPGGRIVFLGGPGTGKTTLLKSMLAERVRKAQLDPAAPLPIFISLPEQADYKTLKDYLADRIQEIMVDGRYAGFIWKAIEDGQAFVCLDSLDEVVPSKRQKVIDSVNAWAYSTGNTWVVGSRFTEYRNGQLSSGQFTEWELQPMDQPLRKELAKRLVEKLHPLLHQADGMAPCEPSEFVHALEEHPRAEAWGENPLLFSLAAVVFVRTGKLPPSRAQMYKDVIDAVLETRTTDSLQRDRLRFVAADVALELYQRKGRIFTRLDLRDALSQVRKKQGEIWDVWEMIHSIVDSGVLDIVAKDTYGFRHQTFQEYLAASALAKRMLNRDEGAWELARKKHTYSQWTEILVLMVGVLLHEHGKAGAQVSLRWLGELLAQSETADGDPGDLALALALKSLGEAVETKNRYWQEFRGIELERKAAETWIRDFADAIQHGRGSLDKRLLALSREIGNLSLSAIQVTMKPLMDILSLHLDFNDWFLHEHEAAMQALRVLGERAPLDPLIAALSDEDSNVRSNVVKILGDLGERAPIDPLVAALQDSDYFVRIAAVEALGKIKAPATIAALIALLSQNNGIEHKAVIEALGNFGANAPIDQLLAALYDKDSSMRESAVEALGQLKERVPVESILIMLQDSDEGLRKTAVEALGALGEYAPIDPLVAVLQDNDLDVRLAAIQALGKLGERIPIETLTAILSDNNENKDIRKAALNALGELAPINMLISALQDDDWLVRSTATQALGKLGERAPVAVLIVTLDDPDWYVRTAAVIALGIRAPMEKLISCLHDSITISQEGSPNLGIAVLEVLGAMGEQVPIEPLVDAVALGRYGVRKAAVQALGKRTSIELLLTALGKSEEEHTRVAAVEQLEVMGKNAPVEALETALNDSDKYVRKAALQAIVALGEQAPIESVITNLRDSEGDVREAAVRALGALKERAPIDPLVSTLHDDNLGVRAAAIQTLGAMGERAPVDVLMTVLYDHDSYVRNAAVQALGALRERVPIEPLVAALHDSEEKVRETMVQVLGALGERAPIEPLVAALHDGENDVRRAVVQALGALGERVPIEPLVAAISDRDVWVRAKAVDALGARASQELLLTALRDRSVYVQAAAIRALGKLGERAPIQLFLKALDYDADIGWAGVEALQRQREHVPIELLINALNNERHLVRKRVVEVLGTLGEQAPIEHLLVALNDRDRDVRKAVVEALGKLEERVPVEWWMISLGDSDQSVRKAAIENLGKRVPVELILAALGDSAAEVRHAAIQVLRDINAEDLVTITPGAVAILKGQGTVVELDSQVQCFIAKIIGEMEYAQQALLDELTRLLDWNYWEVRMMAAKALGNLRRNISDLAIRRLLELRHDPQSRAVCIAADDALAEILSLETSIEDDFSAE